MAVQSTASAGSAGCVVGGDVTGPVVGGAAVGGGVEVVGGVVGAVVGGVVGSAADVVVVMAPVASVDVVSDAPPEPSEQAVPTSAIAAATTDLTGNGMRGTLPDVVDSQHGENSPCVVSGTGKYLSAPARGGGSRPRAAVA